MSVENIFVNAAQIDAQNAILARIASKMGAYDENLSWGALQTLVRSGAIGEILQPGDQLEVKHSPMLTATVEGSGITAATVDADTFLAVAGSDKTTYVFGYDGSNWSYNGSVVSLTVYGITVTGTPASGDVITITKTASVYDFDVEGLDERQCVNANLTHNLSILMHDVYSLVNFDPPNYLFPVTVESLASLNVSGTELPAGTYNLTLDHGGFGNITTEDGTYQFTTTQPVPIGGGIRHTAMGQSVASGYGPARITAGTFITYGADTYTVIEQGLTTTQGSSGTSLGTSSASDPQYRVGDYINFTTRQVYGSNRWSTSWLRQLLNSEDAVLNWVPATIWSRNLNIQPEGYLYAIDPALRAVLAKTRTRYALSITDGYGYEDVEDIVALDTMLDVFGILNNRVAEGPVTADGTVTRSTSTSLWDDASQADKIKYQGSTARAWWLSSPHPSFGYYERVVNTSGELSGNGASGSLGVVPRLTIA